MKTFFDYDHVECVELSIAKKEYPHLDWNKIEKNFVRNVEKFVVGSVKVMTLADLNYCIRLHEEKLDIDEVEYSFVGHCSVCRKVLLPDDAAYTDEKTGDTLCDEHAGYNEETDNYMKVLF